MSRCEILKDGFGSNIGIVTFVDVDFECPECHKQYDESFYYKQLDKSPKGFIYKKCTGCGIKMGISSSMTGDVVVWDKSKEEPLPK